MQLFLKIPPSSEPITLEDVKDYLKLPPDVEESSLPLLIATARMHVENITGRALLKQQWEMQITPPYPPSSPLIRRKGKELEISLTPLPLLEVESIKTENREIPFTVKETQVNVPSYCWDQELSLTYWAGYGETAVSLPAPLKMGTLMAARLLYDNQREDIPLLNPFKIHKLI